MNYLSAKFSCLDSSGPDGAIEPQVNLQGPAHVVRAPRFRKSSQILSPAAPSLVSSDPRTGHADLEGAWIPPRDLRTHREPRPVSFGQVGVCAYEITGSLHRHVRRRSCRGDLADSVDRDDFNDFDADHDAHDDSSSSDAHADFEDSGDFTDRVSCDASDDRDDTNDRGDQSHTMAPIMELSTQHVDFIEALVAAADLSRLRVRECLAAFQQRHGPATAAVQSLINGAAHSPASRQTAGSPAPARPVLPSFDSYEYDFEHSDDEGDFLP